MKTLNKSLFVLMCLITLIGALYAIDRHFAKEAKVQIIREDLDLTRQDNLIMQQRQDINRYEVLSEFERRKAESDDVERAIIKREREKLAKLQIEREKMLQKRK